LGFFPFSRFPIIERPKNEMVEKNTAQGQKKFDYPFFKIRTDKIQMRSTFH
jgi:hypothetical protein